MHVEFSKLIQINAFEPVSSHSISAAHAAQCSQFQHQAHCPRHQIIPMRWVFDYKSDEHGFVTRFKARLCVRGDMQMPDDQDTRTSTLAARTFRTLIAIITRFDLDIY